MGNQKHCSEIESLQFVPIEKWGDLAKTFREDWPLGVLAYNALITQKKIAEMGLDYGFKVYRPHGDITNGMVAFNKKGNNNEVLIHCPKDDTTHLEEALKTTKLIDWSVPMVASYVSDRMKSCLQRVAIGINSKCFVGLTFTVMHSSKDDQPFENIRLPEGLEFRPVSEKELDLVDSTWKRKYDGSKQMFNLFIKKNTSYGLYKHNELVAWAFLNEIGAVAHLHTLEKHRKMGYAKLLLQKMINENCEIFGIVSKDNNRALEFYIGLGFQKLHEVCFLYIHPNKESKL